MELISPELLMPTLELQSILEKGEKKFRVVSSKLDPLFISLLKKGKIRAQIWLERELKKGSGGRIKRSWVHSIDSTSFGPLLFENHEYQYGGGLGWGWMTRDLLPPYSTTNGFVPTEFEITPIDIVEKRIIIKISIIDIFSNILKEMRASTYPTEESSMTEIAFLGRGKSFNQPLRVRLMVNLDHEVHESLPSNPMILGLHRSIEFSNFEADRMKDYIKISYYK